MRTKAPTDRNYTGYLRKRTRIKEAEAVRLLRNVYNGQVPPKILWPQSPKPQVPEVQQIQSLDAPEKIPSGATKWIPGKGAVGLTWNR